MAIICMNVDILTAEAASNKHLHSGLCSSSRYALASQPMQVRLCGRIHFVRVVHLIWDYVTMTMWKAITAYQRTEGLCSLMEKLSLDTQSFDTVSLSRRRCWVAPGGFTETKVIDQRVPERKYADYAPKAQKQCQMWVAENNFLRRDQEHASRKTQ